MFKVEQRSARIEFVLIVPIVLVQVDLYFLCFFKSIFC